MAAKSGENRVFRVVILDTVYFNNLDEIALSCTSIFVFCIFEKKIENSKWPPFLASKIFVVTWKG